LSNTSLVLEALQAAIEDPQKLLKEDYSLKEITHELRSCRSPSDVENDPSLYLRSSTNKKRDKFSSITKEMVEQAYIPTSELDSPNRKKTAFTSALNNLT